MTPHARRDHDHSADELMDRIDPWGERAARVLVIAAALTFGGGTAVQVLPSAVIAAVLGLAVLAWIVIAWLREEGAQGDEEGNDA